MAKKNRRKRKAAKAKAKAKNPLGTLGTWPSEVKPSHPLSLSTADVKALLAQWQNLTGPGIPAPQFANSNNTPAMNAAQFASSSNTLEVKHRPPTPPTPMGIRIREEVRDRLMGQEYGVAGYDVVGASPELACALFARTLKLHGRIVDLLASACYTETEVDAEPLMTERHWAWVVMLDRKDDADKDATVIALVTATQGAPRAVDALGQPLADLLYTLDEFTRGEFDSRLSRQTFQTLPISSNGQLVAPGNAVQPRPQATAFRPKRLFISAIQANTHVTYHASLASAVINAPRPLHVELAGQLSIPVPTLPPVDPTQLMGTAAV
jgi:hypothetical protein